MRGKLPPTKFDEDVYGITPADAGKTFFISFILLFLQDHPRGCGENAETESGCSAMIGSPPRMRGKPPVIADALPTLRITPADAGKTTFMPVANHCNKDHPRGCGENDDIQPEFPNVAGSPPRMRGKLIRLAPVLHIHQDHPRGCGENRSTRH